MRQIIEPSHTRLCVCRHWQRRCVHAIKWDMQPPVQAQVHLVVHNRIQGIFLPSNNSSVERTWQRNHRGGFHQLLQESSALVRRRRSSTWYPTSGFCRLRSRSNSRSRPIKRYEWGQNFKKWVAWPGPRPLGVVYHFKDNTWCILRPVYKI